MKDSTQEEKYHKKTSNDERYLLDIASKEALLLCGDKGKEPQDE